MKLHALAIPHTITSKEYLSCAFTQKVLKFCEMMSPHYEVIHYGHEDSEVDCAEHVTLTTNDDLFKAYGSYDWKKEFFKHDTADHAHQTFYQKGKIELKKRVEQGDAILCFWGNGHQPIADEFKEQAFIIEPGIGYDAGATFAPHKVFESYAVMHTIYGELGKKHPAWYDAVIPNYFDPEDFEFGCAKDNYILYLGRVTEIKGLHIAIDATERAGKKLVIAGQGELKDLGYDRIPSHVKVAGYANLEARRTLLRDAQALILPTHYIEPFGGVTIEALFSGTPIITTDWGCFSENNLHGVTGYRCRNMNHFVWALNNIKNIVPADCRSWAKNNFSLKRVSEMYKEYLENIDDLNRGGFYELNNKNNLNWLNKYYPH
jgi:glycosyltransferase involved in cell wall biosynthesis